MLDIRSLRPQKLTMTTPVSIVTISYNQAQYLERCILSILNQTYFPVEYIVVDGGSTDGSVEILEKYRHRLTSLIIEKDEGPADALNKGFRAARGGILGFLNSDDELLPFAVADAVKALEAQPEVDVISGNALLVDAESRLLRRLYSDHFTMARAAAGAAYLMQPSTFFRRDAFERAGGFNRDNRSFWDGELWFDIARTGGRFGRMDGFLSLYRLHDASMTGSAEISMKLRQHNDNMFRKAFGRYPGPQERLARGLHRIMRHVRNPSGFFERLLHGKISGRA